MLAGGVAFFAMLSIFLALTALVSLYGLVADPRTVERQVAAMGTVLPPEALQIISGWLGGFNLQALALTLGLVLFGILALVFVAIVPAVLSLLPRPDSWKTGLTLARWPILAILVTVVLAAIYRYAPDRADPKWRWVTTGSAIATVLWIAASVGFSIYVSKFGNYDQTYGSLGAVIILLFWFYITSYVILAGGELNAEIERQTARDTRLNPKGPWAAAARGWPIRSHPNRCSGLAAVMLS